MPKRQSRESAAKMKPIILRNSTDFPSQKSINPPKKWLMLQGSNASRSEAAIISLWQALFPTIAWEKAHLCWGLLELQTHRNERRKGKCKLSMTMKTSLGCPHGTINGQNTVGVWHLLHSVA